MKKKKLNKKKAYKDLPEYNFGGDVGAGLAGIAGGALGTIPGVGGFLKQGVNKIHGALDPNISDQEKSILGYGNAAGAIGAGILTGNAAGAISGGAQGIAQGLQAGDSDNPDLAQFSQYLGAAGQIGGAVAGASNLGADQAAKFAQTNVGQFMGRDGGRFMGINPAHKGYCTPMTKATCTPHRKALARTLKKHHGFHENGGLIGDSTDHMMYHSEYQNGGLANNWSEDQIINLNARPAMFPDGGKVNELEGDLISKVIMNRNKGVDFVNRAYAGGDYPNSPMFKRQDPDNFGEYNTHLMGWGTDDKGQAYMFPTIFNEKNEEIKVPNQYADYISSKGYKKATGMQYPNGGITKKVFNPNEPLPTNDQMLKMGYKPSADSSQWINPNDPNSGYFALKQGMTIPNFNTASTPNVTTPTNTQPRVVGDSMGHKFRVYPDGRKEQILEGGGMITNNSNNPNAQLEKEEVMKYPNNSTDQVSAPTHENGGINLNLPQNTKIYSDHLKKDGKTFAKHAEQYKNNKWDKILEDKVADPLRKKTAQMMKDKNTKALDNLFAEQESMKESKMMKYGGKIGYKRGGQVPMFCSGGMMHYGDGGIKGAIVESEDRPGRMIYGEPDATSTDSNMNWGNVTGQVGNFLMQNAGDLLQLGEHGKTYDKVNYGSVTPQYMDPTNTLRDIDTSSYSTQKAIPGMTGGHGGQALNYLLANSRNRDITKAGVRSQYDQTNAGIGNQALYANQGYKMQGMQDEAANKGAALSNYYNTISQVGARGAGQMRDYKTGQLNNQRMQMLPSLFDNPEFLAMLKAQGYTK